MGILTCGTRISTRSNSGSNRELRFRYFVVSRSLVRTPPFPIPNCIPQDCYGCPTRVQTTDNNPFIISSAPAAGPVFYELGDEHSQAPGASVRDLQGSMAETKAKKKSFATLLKKKANTPTAVVSTSAGGGKQITFVRQKRDKPMASAEASADDPKRVR